MPKEMLINVSEGEECRIALLEGGKLEELYMERTSSTSHVNNIYKGRVINVEPSIQASVAPSAAARMAIVFHEANASKVFGGGVLNDLGDGTTAVTLGVVAIGFTDPLPATLEQGGVNSRVALRAMWQVPRAMSAALVVSGNWLRSWALVGAVVVPGA